MEPGSRRDLIRRWEAVAREGKRAGNKATWHPVWLFHHNLWGPPQLRSVRKGTLCAPEGREVSRDSRFTCHGLSWASAGDGDRGDISQETVPGNHGRLLRGGQPPCLGGGGGVGGQAGPLRLPWDFSGPGQCCPGNQQVWWARWRCFHHPQISLTFKACCGLALVSDPDCTSLHPRGPVCSRPAHTFLSPTAGPLLLPIPLLGAWWAGRAAGARPRAGKRSSLNVPSSPMASFAYPSRFLCSECPPSLPRKFPFIF